ncbi:UNVERIFIED_CONTAM: hypothetical protein GTU68_014447 [Idotea baltica]|nr:hypothetical protein [Idotea baltica]
MVSSMISNISYLKYPKLTLRRGNSCS